MGLVYGNPMSENKRDYAVEPRQAAGAHPLQERRVRQPARAAPEKPAGLLIEALDEPVTATIDGGRREITKPEAVVTQLVRESAAADLRATKMLVDMVKGRREISRRGLAVRARALHLGGRGGDGDLHRATARLY
jgi:hypothetical protein